MLKLIIAFCLIYWIAEKLDTIRLTNKRRKTDRIRTDQKEAARIAKENHKLFLECNKWKKEQERERKKREAAQEKAKAQKEKLSAQKRLAGSDLEYINHRLKQLDGLMTIAKEEQTGTNYGSKEWLKAEREIMKLENQAHTLHVKAQKARAIRVK